MLLQLLGKQQLKELNVNQIDESSGIPEPPPKEELSKPHSELPVEHKDMAPLPVEQKAEPAKPLLDIPVEHEGSIKKEDKTESSKFPSETPIEFKDLDDSQKDTSKSSKPISEIPVEFEDLDDSQKNTAELKSTAAILTAHTATENAKYRDLDSSSIDN